MNRARAVSRTFLVFYILLFHPFRHFGFSMLLLFLIALWWYFMAFCILYGVWHDGMVVNIHLICSFTSADIYKLRHFHTLLVTPEKKNQPGPNSKLTPIHSFSQFRQAVNQPIK